MYEYNTLIIKYKNDVKKYPKESTFLVDNLYNKHRISL